MGKSVLLITGDYAEEYELMVPFQALQAYGISVDAVCPGKNSGDIIRTTLQQNKTCGESRGHNFTLNATFSEIDVAKYDGLVVPGGRAPEYLAMDESLVSVVRKFHASKKPIASVCHGPLILVAAGVVKGRRCTAYISVKPLLVAAGAHWVDIDANVKCVVDGNLVTAPTYAEHPELIQHFVTALGGSITGSDKKVLFLCGGKKCTAYPAVKLHVVLAGAIWVKPEPIHHCVTDGNLVTGAAWPGHPEFVSQLMALLGITVSF